MKHIRNLFSFSMSVLLLCGNVAAEQVTARQPGGSLPGTDGAGADQFNADDFDALKGKDITPPSGYKFARVNSTDWATQSSDQGYIQPTTTNGSGESSIGLRWAPDEDSLTAAVFPMRAMGNLTPINPGEGGGGENPVWKIALSDVNIDLDVEGLTDTSQEELEITEGGFVLFNTDTDDGNAQPDYTQNAQVNGENDLIELTLSGSVQGGAGAYKLSATSGGSKIKIWSSEDKSGDPVVLPKTYAAGELPGTLYVEGIAVSSSLKDIELSLDLFTSETNGSLLASDKVKLTSVELSYLRVYDENKTANRSTRAIDPTRLAQKEFEESRRSSAFQNARFPHLVFSGDGQNFTTGDLAVEILCTPSDAKKRFLWKFDVLASASVEETSGSFSDALTVSVPVTPSSENMADHISPDFNLFVGLDKNNDGVLAEEERIKNAKANLWIIGKAEYDYCNSSFNSILLTLLPLGLPVTAQYFDIFLDRNVVLDNFDETEATTLDHDFDDYNQRNALGADQISLTRSTVDLHKWHANEDVGYTVAFHGQFVDEMIIKGIESIGIEDFYNDPENEDVNEKTFTTTHQSGWTFTSQGSADIAGLDLGLSLSGVGAKFDTFTVKTKRNPGGVPQITAIAFEGKLDDLYDFGSARSDEQNSYASRIQTAYDELDGRTGGNIFLYEIALSHPLASFGTGVNFNDAAAIKQRYQLVYIATNL